MSAVGPIMAKEFKHILRDRRSLGTAIVLPLLMLLVFGYAISLDLREVRVGLIDRDMSTASRTLVSDIIADGTVRIVEQVDREEELEAMMDRGVINVGLVVPHGYGGDMAAGRSGLVQVLVDGTEASFAAQAQGRMIASVRHATVRRFEAQIRAMGLKGDLPTVVTRPRVFFNEVLDSRWYIVPGLIAIIIMQVAALLTSQCVAREYEKNTIEQLLVSPMSGPSLMVGKLVPYVGLGIVQVSLVTLCSVVIFHVPLRGSLLLLSFGTLMFLIGSMGLGLLLSAALRSQQVAMQVALVITILPSMLLSGFIFPIENMPGWLQVISYIVPARYYVGITRGLFLKGVGMDVLWPDFVAMAVFATVVLLASITRFRGRLA